jgi:hypothetical protein
MKRKQLDEGDVGMKAGQHLNQKDKCQDQYGIVVPLMGTVIENREPHWSRGSGGM